jgi:hypothetical protein
MATKVQLTQRGRIVRNILLTILFFVVVSFVNDLITPDQCKVPFEELSQGCLNLLYP